MLVYLFGVAVLGWIGGSDTERFLFWAMPVVYLLIGKSIEDHLQLLKSFPLIVILVLSQLISQRLFWSIPEYPNDFSTPIPILTVLTSRAQYLDLWSHTDGNRLIQSISFWEYTLLCIVLLWWLSYRSSQRQLDEQATVSKG